MYSVHNHMYYHVSGDRICRTTCPQTTCRWRTWYLYMSLLLCSGVLCHGCLKAGAVPVGEVSEGLPSGCVGEGTSLWGVVGLAAYQWTHLINNNVLWNSSHYLRAFSLLSSPLGSLANVHTPHIYITTCVYILVHMCRCLRLSSPHFAYVMELRHTPNLCMTLHVSTMSKHSRQNMHPQIFLGLWVQDRWLCGEYTHVFSFSI